MHKFVLSFVARLEVLSCLCAGADGIREWQIKQSPSYLQDLQKSQSSPPNTDTACFSHPH